VITASDIRYGVARDPLIQTPYLSNDWRPHQRSESLATCRGSCLTSLVSVFGVADHRNEGDRSDRSLFYGSVGPLLDDDQS